MKHIIYSIFATIVIAAMFASASVAQVRRSGGSTTERSTSTQTRQSSGTATRSSSSSGSYSSGSSTQVRRSSGSTSGSSDSYRRSSGSSTGSYTRSSGSNSGSTRSSGSYGSGSTTVRRSAGSYGTSSSSASYSNPQDYNRSSGSTTVRRSSGSTNSSSSTVRRSSGTYGSGSTGNGSTVRRSSGTSERQTSSSNHRVARTISYDNVRTLNNSQDNTVRRSAATSNGAGQALRENNNVTRRGLGTVSESMSRPSGAQGNNSDSRDFSGAAANQARRMNSRFDDYYIDDNRDVMRIHPRERDIIYYDRLGHFYGSDPHYFGYRISVLPPRYRRVRYYGIDYYYYDDVYYRPYGSYYVVCRPPFGIYVNTSIGSLAFSLVNFAFYSNVYRSYSGFDSYSNYIDRQNMIIAQNNATIAAQNNYIAMNLSSAQNSYSLANQLGLVQSYAYANQEYYYQDGVFYIMSGSQYQVIVPPAGALVEELPDDYATINLGGAQYYRVDDTVYRVTLINGRPMLEVLGQMYGSMARKYSLF